MPPALRALPLGIVILTPAASGQTATNTLVVSSTVVKVCVVAVTPLTFGNYLANSASPTDATATLTITCTSGTTYTVALDAGTGSGATTSTRSMSFSGSSLSYGLYQDSARSQNWGNNTGTDTASGTGNGGAQNSTVYGRIGIGHYLAPGAYTDTVTVTVTY